jgi:hypothetical protein
MENTRLRPTLSDTRPKKMLAMATPNKLHMGTKYVVLLKAKRFRTFKRIGMQTGRDHDGVVGIQHFGINRGNRHAKVQRPHAVCERILFGHESIFRRKAKASKASSAAIVLILLKNADPRVVPKGRATLFLFAAVIFRRIFMRNFNIHALHRNVLQGGGISNIVLSHSRRRRVTAPGVVGPSGGAGAATSSSLDALSIMMCCCHRQIFCVQLVCTFFGYSSFFHGVSFANRCLRFGFTFTVFTSQTETPGEMCRTCTYLNLNLRCCVYT